MSNRRIENTEHLELEHSMDLVKNLVAGESEKRIPTWPFILGGFALTTLGVYLYASKVEARRYVLDTLKVDLGGSKPLGKKLRVLHLSDLHLCEPESKKLEFLEQVTNDEFDLIVFTGDIFENLSGLQYAPRLIARKPRLGTYAVLGNHDYYDYTWFHKTIGKLWRLHRHPPVYRDVTPLVEALEKADIQVMRNAKTSFIGDGVSIVGIDYPGISAGRLKDIANSMPDEHLKLALFHVPRRLDDIKDAGIDMAFGGHTHGGQIRIPGVGALVTDSELKRSEASGLVRRGDTLFHISRGLGADPRTNFRLFCPPAATILELTY